MNCASTQAEKIAEPDDLRDAISDNVDEQRDALNLEEGEKDSQDINSSNLTQALNEVPNDPNENEDGNSHRNGSVEESETILPGAYRVGGCNGSLACQYAGDSNSLPEALPVRNYPNEEENVHEDPTIDGEIVTVGTRRRFLNLKEIVLIVLVSVVVIVFVSQVSQSKKKPSTLSRTEVIKNLLIPISGEDALNDRTTPQGIAFNHIVQIDPLEIPLTDTKKIIQRYSVITVGLSIATPRLTKLVGLNEYSFKDECDLGLCNGDGEILTFHFAGLSTLAKMSNFAPGLGTISKEIAQLTSLTHLLLYDNELVGTIPTEIGLLKDLQVIDLQNNLLSGPIPTHIGNLERIEWLFLQSNELTGTIPLQIGNLTRLFYMDVSKNMLTGSIPSELESLPDVNGLALHDNGFSGDAEFLCGQTSKPSRSELVIKTINYTRSVDLGVSMDCENEALYCSCCQCT